MPMSAEPIRAATAENLDHFLPDYDRLTQIADIDAENLPQIECTDDDRAIGASRQHLLAHQISALSRGQAPGSCGRVSPGSLDMEGSPKHTEHHLTRLDFENWWLFDLFLITMSAGALFVTIVLLRVHDGKRQPLWQVLSLNSLVSWLSTLSKGCLLIPASKSLSQLNWVWFAARPRQLLDLEDFDAASRGFLGSARLLLKLRGKHFATFGCLALMASLGFDPFIQNLIHYYSGQVEAIALTALTGNSTSYNVLGFPFSAGMEVDPSMKANVYNSIFNPSQEAYWGTPQFSCPNGNCTWDPFVTLEFRSLCSDVGFALKGVCINVTDEFNASVPLCQAYLSNGLKLNFTQSYGEETDPNPNSLSKKIGLGFNATLMVVSASKMPLVYKNMSLISIQSIMATGDAWTRSNDTVDAFRNTRFEATECSIEPYVRKVQAKVTRGVYHEMTLDSWISANLSNARGIRFSPPQRFTGREDNDTTSPSIMTFGDPSVRSKTDAMFYKVPSGLVSTTAMDATSSFFTQIFDGWVTFRAGTFAVFTSIPNLSMSPTYAPREIVTALYNGRFECPRNDHLACAMENVAAAMSKTVRDASYVATGGYHNSNMSQGHVWTTETFIATRASTYRPTYGLSDEWTNEGPPAEAMIALAEYWAQEYSWSDVEESLNKRDHYAITIQGSRNYTPDIPLHFVHQKSTNESAIPLLMLHGWTSTYLEWDKIIEPLGDIFHIVAPDLPGFGFSPAPLESGLGPREMATAFDALMQKLGYKTYGVIGTDIGYFVSSWMVVDVPESIIGHFLDFMLIQPTEDDLERYANNQTTPEENAYIEVMNEFTTNHFAYSVIQAQKPLALSLAMTDSPVGFAGWVWDLKYVASDGYPYTEEEIITESFLIWLQAPYGAMRTYLEILERPESSAFPKSEVVTGVTQWGSENGPFPELADFPLADPRA
ncbi:hypothetical protein G7054_g7213 [Neopestalotiopsis clavispora]|nr:hypothetical protein G7054_g7213 [Neopestalotiopsis clavispora]